MKRPLTLVVTAACLAFVACSLRPPSAGVPAGSSPSPTNEPPTTITTPHWTVRYPSDWRVQRLFDACSGALRGVVVTDTSFAFMPSFDHPCSWRRYGRWEMEGFPDDGVAVAVEPASSFPLGGPDYAPLRMPVTLGELHLTAGLYGGPWTLFGRLPDFKGDAYGYEVRVWIGRDAGPIPTSLLRTVESIHIFATITRQ
jgi:hypothetical protein